MKLSRNFTARLLPFIGALSLLSITVWADKSLPSPTQVSPIPPVQVDTQPLQQNPGGGSPHSTDSLTNTQDYMRYKPYNTYPRELDLWNLEGLRTIRSDAVISPDRRFFAYSEVIFMPQVRQTLSKIYLVPVPALPPPRTPRLPSEEATNSEPPTPPSVYIARFDPSHHFQGRKALAAVGYAKVIPYAFQTLTPVDWSNSSKRLLFKQRSGVLHIGLKVSDIFVYDQSKGTTTIYHEIHRVIQNYWKTRGGIPDLSELAWDIQPLGWEPNSDNLILLKAWAYDHEVKKFLGLWQYDIDAERTQLLSLEDESPTIAANGWLATPNLPAHF